MDVSIKSSQKEKVIHIFDEASQQINTSRSKGSAANPLKALKLSPTS